MPTAGSTPVGETGAFHGSSLRELGAPLDQERAASMADEGGAAGAITDARAQARVLSPQPTTAEERSSTALRVVLERPRRVLPWLALLAAGTALAVVLWRRR